MTAPSKRTVLHLDDALFPRFRARASADRFTDESHRPAHHHVHDANRDAGDCTRGGDIVSDSFLARLTATFVILIGLAFWVKAAPNKLLGCHINCATEFSASGMGER